MSVHTDNVDTVQSKERRKNQASVWKIEKPERKKKKEKEREQITNKT